MSCACLTLRCLSRRRQAVLPERHAARQVPAAGGAQPCALHLCHEVPAALLAHRPPLPPHRPLRGAHSQIQQFFTNLVTDHLCPMVNVSAADYEGKVRWSELCSGKLYWPHTGGTDVRMLTHSRHGRLPFAPRWPAQQYVLCLLKRLTLYKISRSSASVALVMDE